MRPIHLVHVISDTNLGGAGQYLISLVEALDKERFQITVLLPPRSVLEPLLKEVTCIQVEGISDRSLSLQGLVALYKTLKALRPDLVHTHGSLSGRLAGQLLGIQGILTTKHTLSPKRKGLKKISVALLHKCLRGHVVAVSKAIEDNLLQEGVKEEKVHCIHNGLPDPGPPEADPAQPAEILMVARMDPIKGHDRFFDILSLLKKKDLPAYRVCLVGAGALEEHLRERAVAEHLPVVFLGALYDRQVLFEHYKKAAVVVNTSLSEAFSLSALEAMFLERPVVAFDLPGIREVVENGQTGILVAGGDLQAFAEALATLLTQPEKVGEMGKAGRKRALEHFTHQAMVASIEHLYEEIFYESNR